MNESPLYGINEAALQLIPERIARSYCILPKCYDDVAITLYCPDEQDFQFTHADNLRFLLNQRIHWVPISRIELEKAIDRYYPMPNGYIQNCHVRFRFTCPRTWSSLTKASDVDQRHCPQCNRTVYKCNTEAEAKWLGRQGKCIAILIPDEGEFLGEPD